jgi:hypothetical protein
LIARLLSRLLFLAAALLVLMRSPRIARAEADESVAPLPRDVVVMVQPSAADLPPLPNDFVRVDRGWIVFELPGTVRDRVDGLSRDADDLRTRLAADLGQPVLEHVLVRIARTPDQMSELAPQSEGGGARVPAYAVGVADPSVHLALLALQAPQTWEAPDLPEVLRHELTHLALADAVGGRHVPRWFDEGLAIHESGELPLARFWALWDATLSKSLLPLSELDRGFPADRYEVNIAYAESADFVRFLMRDSDRARYGSLIERVRAGTPFDRALEDAYGIDARKLEYEWREDRSHRFGLTPVLTGSALLWVLIAGLMVAAWVKRRRRAKAKLAEWAREEADIDAALAASRQPATAPVEATGDEPIPAPRTPSIPVVEHDGRWYTLH